MVKKAVDDGATTEVVVPDEVDYVNKMLDGIGNYVPDSWDDLTAWVEEHGEGIIEFKGSAWEVLSDKSLLVGVPFLIADVRAYKGKFGPAVAICLLTQQPLPGHDDNKYVINDGSTGIHEQVMSMIMTAKRKTGISCPRGLRASDYIYVDDKGNEIPATTYYVA